MQRLTDKTAIVTGAGRGIGKAIADRFEKEGAAVARLDRDAGPGIDVMDVTDENAVDRAIDAVADRLGRIDILVNNAAASNTAVPVADLSAKDWRISIDVNLTGVFLVSRAALRHMRAAQSGTIINIASQLGRVAVPNRAAYCASKGGVLQLTRAMALDHADDGIRVNALSPGAVATERLLDTYGSAEAASAALAPKHPIGRIGLPQDITGAAVFLASDEAGFMTGSDLLVDGGYSAQ